MDQRAESPSRRPHPFRAAVFLKSAASPRDFPPDAGREVAFAGRSNAGKSSVINALAGNRRLARTGKTPGLTRLINFFTVRDGVRLVDLPGYGFARVAANVRAGWERAIDTYLRGRRSLAGLVVIMDARHPFTPADQAFLATARAAGREVHVLLNKADKLSRGEAARTLREATAKAGPGVSVQLFSAAKGDGLEALETVLDGWLSD